MTCLTEKGRNEPRGNRSPADLPPLPPKSWRATDARWDRHDPEHHQLIGESRLLDAPPHSGLSVKRPSELASSKRRPNVDRIAK
jgi:hypothetical protein